MKKLDSISRFILPIFTLIIFSTLPAFAMNFDFGTQFGTSRLVPAEDLDSTRITYTRLPSGSLFDIGTVPPSLYAMFYPHKHIGLGPEFSFGRISVSYEDYDTDETESITTLHVGGKLALYLMGYQSSSPYIMGRASVTSYSGEFDDFLSIDDTDNITSIGIGAGYQFVIKSAFILRLEARLNALTIEDENATEYGLIISIGTRFGQ